MARPQRRTARFASVMIFSLLARCSTRPTAPVEARCEPYRNADAGRVFVGYQVLVTSSRLSSQVYTPIGRQADDPTFFRFFSQVRGVGFRKVRLVISSVRRVPRSHWKRVRALGRRPGQTDVA